MSEEFKLIRRTPEAKAEYFENKYLEVYADNLKLRAGIRKAIRLATELCEKMEAEEWAPFFAQALTELEAL